MDLALKMVKRNHSGGISSEWKASAHLCEDADSFTSERKRGALHRLFITPLEVSFTPLLQKQTGGGR